MAAAPGRPPTACRCHLMPRPGPCARHPCGCLALVSHCVLEGLVRTNAVAARACSGYVALAPDLLDPAGHVLLDELLRAVPASERQPERAGFAGKRHANIEERAARTLASDPFCDERDGRGIGREL